MNFVRKLPIPKDIKAQFPVSREAAAKREAILGEIKDVFEGKSNKFLLVIGPCSADNRDAVLAYLERLAKLRERVEEKLLIVPRIYTNKPRTTGDGYKGMLHQPDPKSRPDLLAGIIAIRELHRAALEEYGFTAADEMLYPENYRYLSDLLGYVAIGARSVENQQHRLTASGLDIPVGMKNPTGGDMHTMIHSIHAAQGAHTFLYRGWEVHSDGNPYAHAILRGFLDHTGRCVSNYHYEDLLQLLELYGQTHLHFPAAVVDVNHANSGKRYLEQIRIVKDVTYSCNHNEAIRNLVKGVMVESYLADGAQSVGEDTFGKSITDPCLGWEKTEKLVLELCDELK
ncbi:MAG: 3-deoxy-7-phosphoheptulonate synthase [Clostridia bacterium]|nr:3-deoxy-7-phosphoheptulonate synthase [Clostridia bacterium]